MIRSSFRKVAASAAIAGLMAAPLPARADLEGALSSMLGANVQVNNPGSIASARRGGFYGGSIYIRGKVMNVNVINFTPPSFAAGCGGIDLFGGSFSMINKEQFIALLRSVAQNAAGYAFHLALKNICEQCSTIMSQLQRVIQEMNQFTGNSCQLAKGIVNGGIQALELSDVKGMQTTSIGSGFQDAFDAFWGSLTSTIGSLTASNSDGSSDYDKFEVNVVWAAMQNSGVQGWFNSGDRLLMEALMTLTGTVILSGPVNDSNGDPSRNVVSAVAGGKLNARDLVYGNSQAQVLRCDSTTSCLNVNSSTTNLTGLQELLSSALVGTGPADSNSILFRLINGTGTPADAGTVIGRLGTYGSMLLSIAEESPAGSTVAYDFFDLVKERLAYELLVIFVTDVVSAVDQAVSNNNYETAYADDWRRNDFGRAIERINTDLKTIGERTAVPADTITTFMNAHDFLVRNYSPLRGGM